MILFLAALVRPEVFVPSLSAVAQQSPSKDNVRPTNLSQTEIDRIVRSFTAKETEFRQALNQYSFRREVIVQQVGGAGEVEGEYRRDSQFIFDDKANRIEKVIFSPISTLANVIISKNDLEDLGGIQPFALETSKINQYNFKFIGKQKIDELDLYVFEVAPKVEPDPKKSNERFFKGSIWVDDKDLQIVKTRGKGVPEVKGGKNEALYPIFETYREQVDGKYWFPTYTYSDDTLDFSGGPVHVKEKVEYKNYEKFSSKVIIRDVEEKPDQKPNEKLNEKPKTTPKP
ncbi:MAG: hypothetical protein ACRD4L_10435 [Pyrinomonadaceae bacterium]